MLPRERVERRLALQWLGWAVLTAALALAGAFLVVFRVRRPLAALTRAAADIGRGRIPGAARGIGSVRDPHRVARLQPDGAGSRAARGRSRAGARRRVARPPHAARPAAPRARDGRRRPAAQDRHDVRHRGHRPHHRPVPRLRARRRAASRWPPSISRALAREIAGRYREAGHALDVDVTAVPELALRPLADPPADLQPARQRLPLRRAARSLLRVVPAAGGAVIEVLDRGPGIPADEVERLKQPFTRIETETARSGKGGSGLGLAIVDRIARMHGGTFDLAPRDGGGLIARVAFPRSQPPARLDQVVAVPPASSPTAPGRSPSRPSGSVGPPASRTPPAPSGRG